MFAEFLLFIKKVVHNDYYYIALFSNEHVFIIIVTIAIIIVCVILTAYLTLCIHSYITVLIALCLIFM